MYTLSNQDLTVSILDPVKDVNRLGSRYCTGGYIWQVGDSGQVVDSGQVADSGQVGDERLGRLLAGPEYPREPNTFDGQGMPEMFHRPLGAEYAAVGDEVGCIGVGRVRRSSPNEPFDVRFNREVIEFVQWQVQTAPQQIIMRTQQTFRGWAFALERQVSLQGRTVTSRTHLLNQADESLPVRWFPHPFFPLTRDDVLCAFSIPVRMPENPGFFIDPQGRVARKPEHDWQTGWFQPLDYEKIGETLSVTQWHPITGQVQVTTDYMPSFLPIWANANTFSFEPYHEIVLHAAESAMWSISYQF